MKTITVETNGDKCLNHDNQTTNALNGRSNVRLEKNCRRKYDIRLMDFVSISFGIVISATLLVFSSCSKVPDSGPSDESTSKLMVEKQSSLVKVLDSGPNDETISKLMVGKWTPLVFPDSVDYVRANLTKITEIERGSVLESMGGSKLPEGTKIYPIRFKAEYTPIENNFSKEKLQSLETTQKVSLHFFKDSFGDWKVEDADE
jgi:hypothetical protein